MKQCLSICTFNVISKMQILTCINLIPITVLKHLFRLLDGFTLNIIPVLTLKGAAGISPYYEILPLSGIRTNLKDPFKSLQSSDLVSLWFSMPFKYNHPDIYYQLTS